MDLQVILLQEPDPTVVRTPVVLYTSSTSLNVRKLWTASNVFTVKLRQTSIIILANRVTVLFHTGT